MRVCMYVCMCVCVHVFAWVYVMHHEWMSACVNACFDGLICVWVYMFMYVCMCQQICMHTCYVPPWPSVIWFMHWMDVYEFVATAADNLQESNKSLGGTAKIFKFHKCYKRWNCYLFCECFFNASQSCLFYQVVIAFVLLKHCFFNGVIAFWCMFWMLFILPNLEQ